MRQFPHFPSFWEIDSIFYSKLVSCGNLCVHLRMISAFSYDELFLFVFSVEFQVGFSLQCWFFFLSLTLEFELVVEWIFGRRGVKTMIIKNGFWFSLIFCTRAFCCPFWSSFHTLEASIHADFLWKNMGFVFSFFSYDVLLLCCCNLFLTADKI